MSPLAHLAQFLFIVVAPLVVVAGALVTLFLIGALFDLLEHPDELRSRIQSIFRHPLATPQAPGKDHYYKPYWASR